MVKREDLLKEKVEDINLSKKSKIKDLIFEFKKIGGFTARKIYEGYKILEEMLDKAEIKVLSFPACIISTGLRGLIAKAIKKKLFNLIISTCGTLDHDIARTFSNYYKGFFEADDIMLSNLNIHRLGNVFIPRESYGETIENFMREALRKIYERKKILGTYEFVWELGKEMERKVNEIIEEIKNENKEIIKKIKENLKVREEKLIDELRRRLENSIIYQCYKNKVPMVIPGITDGAVGTNIFVFKLEKKDFEVSVWKDEEYLSKIFFGEKDIGALIIGGGISKHHTIWWAQFSNGLKYSVYITTAVEYDGSLSGARTREAISWGKIKKEAKHVTIEGDATVIFPILISQFI